MTIPISAIVLTKNEEDNLPECLASLKWADEVLVVDSFSTDRTIEIAQTLGARVLQHPFENFAAQHNYAQSQATHDWVLFIDADERVSDELRDEIKALATNDQLIKNHAYHIQRVHLVSGRWFPDLKKRRVTPKLHASIRKLEVPRLLDRTQGTWERPLHEIVNVPQPTGVLDNVIYHYASTNLSALYESFNRYTDVEAAHLQKIQNRQRVRVIEALLRGLRSFLFAYFGLGWWKLGEQGLLLSINMGYTKFMNYAKFSERLRIQHNIGIWTDQDRKLLERFPPKE